MGFTETLEMARGETPTMTVSVTNGGVVFSLVGYSATLYVREDPGDAVNYLFSVAGVIATPASGVIAFTIPKTSTASLTKAQCKPYYFDVRIDDGLGGHEFSVARGTLDVLATAKKKT